MCRKVSDVNLKSPSHMYAITLVVGTWLACSSIAGAFAVDYNGMRTSVTHMISEKISKKPIDMDYHDDI